MKTAGYYIVPQLESKASNVTKYDTLLDIDWLINHTNDPYRFLTYHNVY